MKLFQESLKMDRLDRRSTLEGTSPIREFLERSRIRRAEQLVRELEIESCSELLLRSRTWSL